MCLLIIELLDSMANLCQQIANRNIVRRFFGLHQVREVTGCLLYSALVDLGNETLPHNAFHEVEGLGKLLLYH
jgi:hypothetical protein